MVQVFIGLGSNLGDGKTNLLAAWHRLGERPDINLVALSRPFRTKPVDMESDLWFTNAVGKLETSLGAETLLALLLGTEKELGRDRGKGRDRTVDLDILYYNGLICHEPGLTLPHPEIQHRLFVLAPLAELAPDHRHPILGLTTAQMLTGLADQEQAAESMEWNEQGEPA